MVARAGDGKPRVAVVGVGSVGLTALRWCVARGLDVVGFERGSHCGGVWRHGSPHSAAYDSLFTNSSRRLMELPDFPWPFETGPFPKHEEVLRYYEAYMHAFELGRLVQWSTAVVGVRKEGAQWEVALSSSSSSSSSSGLVQGQDQGQGLGVQTRLFDAVLVCSGKLWDPKLPPWAGALAAAGGGRVDVLHAKEYRNPDRFRSTGASRVPGAPKASTAVVVVGNGNSAMDIALELSLEEDVEVSISCRRGTSVVPTQNAAGQPLDLKLATRFMQYWLPRAFRLAYLLSHVRATNVAFAEAGMPAPPSGVFGPHSPSANLKQAAKFVQQLRRRKIRFVPELSGALASGALASGEGTDSEGRGPGLREPTELGLVDGGTVRGDAVVCCTGYALDMDKALGAETAGQVVRKMHWEDEDSGQRRSLTWLRLYLKIMHPEDPSLFFLGMVTSFGNETCIGDMQARWATAVLAGLVAPPSAAEVAKDVAKTEASLRRTRPSVSGFVRYVPYMDSLARLLGAMPDVRFTRNPRTYLQVQFGPVVPAQYRLLGPDAIPGLASRL